MASSLYGSLMVWLETFDKSGHSLEYILYQNITTGVYLHNHVCATLSPELFALDAINIKPGTNWMVRRNNLKKVANGIRIYIEQILNAENTGVPDVEDFLSEIDLGLMAKDALCENEATKEEMTKLVQLILSSCVHGDNQAAYVQTIMGLDEDVQEQLMHSIHGMSDLFQSGANGSPPPSPLSSPKANSRSSRNSFDLDDPFGSPQDTHRRSKRSSSGGSGGSGGSGDGSSSGNRRTSTNSTTSSATNMRLAEQLDETKRNNIDLQNANDEMMKKMEVLEKKMKENEKSNKKSEVAGDTNRQAQLKAEKDRDKAMAHVSELEEKMEMLVDELSNLRSKTSETESKYSSEGAAREWSTVVDISVPLPSYKPVSLYLSRSPLSKTPKQVFFNPINIF